MIGHGTRGSRAGLLLAVCVGATVTPAAAQDRVTIDQVQVRTIRPDAGASRPAIQEADYILSSQSGITLMSPGPALPTVPAGSQARVLQSGVGNTSTVDMSGNANAAFQSIVGARNTVTQEQSGSFNQSSVTVFGNTNTVGTRQDGNGAAATVTVRGDSNVVTAQQQGNNPLPISITQVGNGGSVSVSRK
jgi:minor curlin subunit